MSDFDPGAWGLRLRYMAGLPCPAPQPLTLERLSSQWTVMSAALRRASITFVVEALHPGPMLIQETPGEGARVELSPLQLMALHRQWPLKLSKIISEDAAEFVPVMGIFNEPFASSLPLPPYEWPAS